jgi:hypothetical protein
LNSPLTKCDKTLDPGLRRGELLKGVSAKTVISAQAGIQCF